MVSYEVIAIHEILLCVHLQIAASRMIVPTFTSFTDNSMTCHTYYT